MPEIRQLTAKPEAKEILDKMGFEPFNNDPEQTAALLKSDVAKCAEII